MRLVKIKRLIAASIMVAGIFFGQEIVDFSKTGIEAITGIESQDIYNFNNIYAKENDVTYDDSGKESDSYSNEWVDGKWYNSDGTQTYASIGEWKSNGVGWWFEDGSGWYPYEEWQKIDGQYYYFKSSGYMDYSGYRDGCFLGPDGSWIEEYRGGRWCNDSSGWWYLDSTGWYPQNQYLKIDGRIYWFDEYGYIDQSEWALILVNRDNPVPDNYYIQLTSLDNGKQVDSRIYPALQQMFNDARNQGIDMFVREGYRSREYQQSIMNNRINQYQNMGYSYDDAYSMAKKYVAIPGTSEHEIGICVDINANNNVSTDSEVYTWLDNNAYKYGFIKRYPENKTEITGINNEPWHYRYVGKSAAAEMIALDMCLEEYIDYLGK
ncbi:MAG: D-alanyl-D-alanine carboxypeptidase family protein [Eubacterium sp.]|nr:D-alanyl-D-alanine carboxypeptidase family protein [Eubacterium sp.]